jgi:hypothetical protein
MVWTFRWKVNDDEDNAPFFNQFRCQPKDIVSINYIGFDTDHCVITTKTEQMVIPYYLLIDITIHIPLKAYSLDTFLYKFPDCIRTPLEKMEFFWYLCYQYNSQLFPYMGKDIMNEEYGNEANFLTHLNHFSDLI